MIYFYYKLASITDQANVYYQPLDLHLVTPHRLNKKNSFKSTRSFSKGSVSHICVPWNQSLKSFKRKSAMFSLVQKSSEKTGLNEIPQYFFLLDCSTTSICKYILGICKREWYYDVAFPSEYWLQEPYFMEHVLPSPGVRDL